MPKNKAKTKIKIPKGLRLVNVEDGPICIEQDELKELLGKMQEWQETIAITGREHAKLIKAHSTLLKKYTELKTKIDCYEQLIVEWFGTKKQVTIPKATYDRLLEQDEVKPHQIIAVYSFYYYTAIWQKTNQPKATVSYVSKGLKLGQDTIRACRKQLKKMGLIKDIKRRNDNHITHHFVQVCFFESIPTLGKTYRVEKPEVNTYSNYKEILLLSQEKPCERDTFFSKPENESFPHKCARRLHAKIVKKGLLTANAKPMTWESQFRRLVSYEYISKKRIRKVLSWYLKNINLNEYVPKAYSARAFVDKFIKIEDAMQRQKNENKKPIDPMLDEDTPTYLPEPEDDFGAFWDK